MRTPLCELALHYDTDKCPEWRGNRGHAYTPFYYHQLLRGRQVRNVLEIGIESGASLRMWAAYWPEAEIYGLDNDRAKLIEDGRIHSLFCDQGSESSLLQAAFQLAWTAGWFDLIVDDGSHFAQDQILAAKILTGLLAPGGAYVIEDVQPDGRAVLDGLRSGRLPILYRPVILEFDTQRLPDDRLIVMENSLVNSEYR